MKTSGRVRDLAIVRSLLRRQLPSAVADVYLFGSTASGTARRYSDVDLAVLPRHPLAPGTLAELRERFAESSALVDVDLINLDDADSDFRQAVLAQGIRWND